MRAGQVAHEQGQPSSPAQPPPRLPGPTPAGRAALSSQAPSCPPRAGGLQVLGFVLLTLPLSAPSTFPQVTLHCPLPQTPHRGQSHHGLASSHILGLTAKGSWGAPCLRRAVQIPQASRCKATLYPYLKTGAKTQHPNVQWVRTTPPYVQHTYTCICVSSICSNTARELGIEKKLTSIFLLIDRILPLKDKCHFHVLGQ